MQTNMSAVLRRRLHNDNLQDYQEDSQAWQAGHHSYSKGPAADAQAKYNCRAADKGPGGLLK